MNIRVATFNFYSRPHLIFNDNQVYRAKLLVKEILKTEEKDGKIDVLCLQEIIDNKVHKILKKELKSIGFIFKSHRLDKRFKLNGGIITYSRVPIIYQSPIFFKNNSIWFSTVAKGALCITIMKNTKKFHIFNIHLDTFNKDFRERQMETINTWIYNKNMSNDDSIIICGDFNINYYREEYKNITDIFKYNKVNLDISSFSKFSSDINNDWIKRRTVDRLFYKKKTQEQKQSTLIDFFIHKSKCIDNAIMKTIDLEHEQKIKKIICSTPFFCNLYSPFKNKIVKDLSDHYMVICNFNIKN